MDNHAEKFGMRRVQVWVQLARSFGGKIGVKRCRINDKL